MVTFPSVVVVATAVVGCGCSADEAELAVMAYDRGMRDKGQRQNSAVGSLHDEKWTG